MAATCPSCGKKVGGTFGMVTPTRDIIERAGKAGLDLPENICGVCLEKMVLVAEKEKEQELAKAKKQMSEEIERMFMSPSDIPADAENLGLVTGYCVLGTGPISSIASAFTDMFGEQSKAYLDKIEQTEKYALINMKAKALKMGANAVYNVRVNLAEATSGHGMIMIAASGAAAKR